MAGDHLQGLEPGSEVFPEPLEEERTSAASTAQGDSRGHIVAIGAAIFCISGLHFVLDGRLFMWHNILHHLYVLPIMFAALRFGWRGGLIATSVASISYVPHALTANTAQPFPGYLLSKGMALMEYFLAAAVIGALSEKDRRQRRTLEQTTKRLSRTYYELQGSIERMKRAERLYAAGQLSAGLAHEIRNPIASIAGAAGLLQRNPDSGNRPQECLEIISKECTRLNRLLTSFLDFAKPRSPNFQTVDVESLLDSVIGLAVHAIDQQPISIRKNVGPDLPRLECDAEQIRQVLLNLILNAIQAMSQGGEITLSAKVQDHAIVIAVLDQGCGISPENLGRLFDPFFTTKETGTGLGLAVAHQIVAQHGGSLWTDPNPDRGMTFSLRLPLRRLEVL